MSLSKSFNSKCCVLTGGASGIGFALVEALLNKGAVDKQTVQLYLTPQKVLPKKEFLAFEYVYSQRQ